MAAFQKIRTSTAANFVARWMADKYCNTPGTEVERRRAVFSRWACGTNGATCEDLYQEHYCPGTDSVCRITTDASVGRLGGMRKRTCRYSAPGGTGFTCWYVNPANAQGHTGSWQQPPLEGGGGISPLAFAFYVYWTPDGAQARPRSTWEARGGESERAAARPPSPGRGTCLSLPVYARGAMRGRRPRRGRGASPSPRRPWRCSCWWAVGGSPAPRPPPLGPP